MQSEKFKKSNDGTFESYEINGYSDFNLSKRSRLKLHIAANNNQQSHNVIYEYISKLLVEAVQRGIIPKYKLFIYKPSASEGDVITQCLINRDTALPFTVYLFNDEYYKNKKNMEKLKNLFIEIELFLQDTNCSGYESFRDKISIVDILVSGHIIARQDMVTVGLSATHNSHPIKITTILDSSTVFKYQRNPDSLLRVIFDIDDIRGMHPIENSPILVKTLMTASTKGILASQIYNTLKEEVTKATTEYLKDRNKRISAILSVKYTPSFPATAPSTTTITNATTPTTTTASSAAAAELTQIQQPTLAPKTEIETAIPLNATTTTTTTMSVPTSTANAASAMDDTTQKPGVMWPFYDSNKAHRQNRRDLLQDKSRTETAETAAALLEYTAASDTVEKDATSTITTVILNTDG